MFYYLNQVNTMVGYAWADYVLFFVIFFNVMFGLARGLFKEIIAFMCLVVAFVIAARFTLPIAEWLNASNGFLDVVLAFSTFTPLNVGPVLSYIGLGVSFLLLFVGAYSTGEAVNWWASKRILVFPIAVIDHIIGGVLGFIRGVVFSLIIIMIIGMTPLSIEDGWTQAYLVNELKTSADQLANYVRPGGFPSWENLGY